MIIEHIAKTDVGKKRDHNEDAFGVYADKKLFFVCDGMGGHAAGDYASNKVVDTIISLIDRSSSKELSDIILKAPADVSFAGRLLATLAMMANRLLFKLAVMYPKLRGMGTTFAAVLFNKNYVNIINVGDSRVYRLRDSVLTQLTVDHSWVEELLQDGELKQDDLTSFREKNVITRAMGTGAEVKVDWKSCELKDGDIFLLCSDGLCGEIEDDVISRVLVDNADDLDRAASELINAANNSGGSDNITVILVKVKGEIPPDLPQIKMNKIVTITPNDEITAKMDVYIDKNCGISTAAVPKGVEKEKTKLHKNPIFIAILSVICLFAVITLIKKPWIEKTVVSADLKKGDILVRTVPHGAVIKLFSGEGDLMDEKTSPADFLSLDEGDYRLEIEKPGYETQVISVSPIKGEQEIREVSLVAKAKIQLSLGITPGFDPSDEVYIDGNLCNYYGKPLTVQRIGVVGKNISVERNKAHTVRIGNKEKVFSIPDNQESLQLKIEDGDIFVE